MAFNSRTVAKWSYLCASTLALTAGTAQAQVAPNPERRADLEVQPQAGGGVEEIVVTAQRRSENLQKTPIAITAITAAGLQAQGITSLSGVVQASPSLYFAPYPSSSTTLVLFMRGQGTGDPMQITKDGGVGLYVDGIYQARPQTSSFDLADVERVEVLRGPQGTLYGRNTSGGAVNIISKKPTGELGVTGQLSLGNYDYKRALVNVNLPEFANFKVKLSGLYAFRNGWAKNAANTIGVPDANDFQSDRKFAARGAVRWEPSSDLTVDYSADYANMRTTPVRYVNDSPFAPLLFPGYTADPNRTYRAVYLPYSYTKTDGQTLILEYRPSSSLALRSLTGYRHTDFAANQDYVEAFLTPFSTQDRVKSKVWTQEFQAVGDFADQFKYVLGLYYFDERAEQTLIVDAGTGTMGQLFESDRTTSATSISKAAYGQLTWTPDFADGKVDLTLGARYTDDERRASRVKSTAIFLGATSPLVNRRFNGAGVTVPLGTTFGMTDVKNKKFNPSITLAYRPVENVSTYAKVVTGYRAGGAQQGSPTFSRTFGPESVTSYEIGLKTDLFDRRLRINVDGYIAKYKDLQLDISADPVDPATVDTFNAGRATVKGFEAEATLVPVEALTLQASYNYTEYKISQVFAPAASIFDPVLNPATPTRVGEDVSGYFVLPFTPKHAVRLSGDWKVGEIGAGELTLHADYTWKSQVFTTSGVGPRVPFGRDFPVNDAYSLVDGRLTYRIDRGNGRDIAVSLWGKNILDERYPGFVIGFGSPISGYSAKATSFGDPATYGVDVSFAF